MLLKVIHLEGQFITFTFSYQKIIVNQSSMLLKIGKNSTKSKAISSYMLSGINIKRMIQDQMANENNGSDMSIIRVSKRPIFKLKEREKAEAEVNISLPSKSFKIRSYTRKMKEGKEAEDSCEIFEKVDKVRNTRNNSNRMELFNLSRETKQRENKQKEYKNKDDHEIRIQNKLKQILQRQVSIKCKTGSQVFIKQQPPILSNNPPMRYQQFHTEKYREMAHKINAYFNPHFQHNNEKQTLLIVSLQGLIVNSKRAIKGVPTEQGKYAERWISQEQIELLKMLSSTHYPDPVWKQARLAYKVNNSQELQDLKLILEANQISNYFCIFYSIKKYVECWNLYQIDGLMQNTSSIVLLETKHRLKKEFPILNLNDRVLFVVTNYENLVMLSRTIAAIKFFIIQQNQAFPLLDKEDSCAIEEDLNSDKNAKPSVTEFGWREELVTINWCELDARLEFTINSRAMKNNNSRHHNKSATGKESIAKRRVLCERDDNCPHTISKNNKNVSFNSAVLEEKWQNEPIKQEPIEQIKQNLLFYLRTERINDIMSQGKGRKLEWTQKYQKDDELQEITNYVRGSACRSKTKYQLISQLLKKNTAIHRQTENYLASIVHITHNSTNASVSAFKEQEGLQHQSKSVAAPSICAYKIL